MLEFVPSDILRQICTNLPIKSLALLFGTLNKRMQHAMLLPGVIERLDIDSWSFEIATFVYSLQNLTNVRIGKIVANHFIEHLMTNPIEKIEINHTLVLGYDGMIEDLDEEEKRGFYFPSIPLVAWTQNAFIPNFGSMFPRLRQLFLNHAIDKLVDNVRGGPFHGLDDMQEHYECALDRDDPSYASESSLSSVPEDYNENISSSSSWSDIYHRMDELDASREAAIANLFATVPRQLELLHINLPPEHVSPMIYFAHETLLLLPTQSITSLELNFGNSTWCDWHRYPQPLKLLTLGAEFPSMVHFKMGLMVSTDQMITDPKHKTFGIPPAPYEVFERPEWADSDITDYRFISPVFKNPLKGNLNGAVPMEVDPKLPSLESLHFVLTTLGCLYLTSFELPPHLQRLTIEAFPITFSLAAAAPHTIPLSRIIEQSNLSWPDIPPPSFHFPHTLTELSLLSVTLGIDYFRLLPTSLVKLVITDDDAQPETGLGVVLASEPTRLPNLQSLRIVGSSKDPGVFKPQVSLAFIPSTVTELEVGSCMSGSLLNFDAKDFHSLQRLCTHESRASNLFELFKRVPESCIVVSKSTLRITKDEWLELMTSSNRSLPICVCPETVIQAIDQHFGRRLTATFHLHVPAPDRRSPMQESCPIVTNHEADSVSFYRDSVHSNSRIHLDWNRLSPMFFNSLGNLSSMVIEAEGALHELTSRAPKFAPFTCKTLTNLCLNVPLPAVLPLSNFPPHLTTLRLYGSHRFGTLMELHTIASLACLDVPFCTIRPFEKIHTDLPQLALLSCTLDFNTDEEMASVLSGLTSLQEARLRGYGCFTSELIPMNPLSTSDHCEEDSVALIPESMLPWISALEEVEWVHLDEGLARRLALLGDPSFQHLFRYDDAD